jgi:hypothetical protein
MNASAAAAVIDLETFRRQRQERQRPARAAAARQPAVVMMPVWIAWVPVWPVA